MYSCRTKRRYRVLGQVDVRATCLPSTKRKLGPCGKPGVMATLDTSAKNLHLFATDHWLSDARNCLVLRLTEHVWEPSPGDPQPARLQLTPAARMQAWTVSELVAFLLSQDLEGPAKFLQTQGFNGSDFLAATGESLVAELRCTPFAARKLLRARDLFLEVNA